MSVEGSEIQSGKGKWMWKNVLVGVNPVTGKKYFEKRKVWVPAEEGFLKKIFRNKRGASAHSGSGNEKQPTESQFSVQDRIDAARNEYTLGADKYDPD